MDYEQMRILFLNDTRIESNLGCQATVTELSDFVRKSLPKAEIKFINLGYGYEIFENSVYSKGNFFKRVLNKLSRKLGLQKKVFFEIKRNFVFKKWKKLALHNLPTNLKSSIQNADLVLINMEGTIHHDSIGGFTLMAYSLYSKRIGKRVCMINGSYQKMNADITRSVLPFVDFLSVRDSYSAKYLTEQNISHYVIPDFAFRSDIHKTPFEFKKISEVKYCLYTPGVLAVYPKSVNGMSISKVRNHISEIREHGYEPIFLKIEEKEDFIEKNLKEIGVQSISYQDGLNYSNIGSLLGRFEILISGRYHIGIFGLMNRSKTYFLPSNTYKIEGMLGLLKIPTNILINDSFSIIQQPYNFNYELPDDSDFEELNRFLTSL